MKKRLINLGQIQADITNLMIENDDAYNWGLAHAMLVMNGADVAAVKQQRDRVRIPVK